MGDIAIFAKRLKEAREAKGLKQNELASVSGLTPQTISAYEKGTDGEKGKKPTLENALAVADALDVSLNWLCGRETNLGQLRTMGDVAYAITRILDIFPMMCGMESIQVTERQQTGVHETADYGEIPYYEDVEVTVPALLFKRGEIRTFLEDLVKMKKLLEEKTFDYNFYERWLNDRIQSLSSISLYQGWEELPF